MNRYGLSIVFFFLFGLVSTASAQQGPMGGRNPGAAFAQIFGNNVSFSATAEMNMTGGRGGEHSMEMKYAVLDGQVRMDMDMSTIQGGEMRPEALERMKQMGMDKSTTLVKPAEGTTYMIYPGMKAYVEVHPPAAASGAKKPDVQKTRLGMETIDGHPTVKYQISVEKPDGGTNQVTTWEATDMNNFPIKAQFNEGQTVATLTFKDIKQSKPDASLFVVPTDYKQYDSMRAMMMSQMGGMMGRFGGGGN